MNKLLLCTRIRLQLLVACMFSLLFFLVSCSDDAETFSTATFESQEMSDEILEKIAYGCDSYFDQELSGRKNETSASDEYIALLEQRLSQFVANKSITASDNNMVGVIKSDKVKGCGKYKEVEVYYDCQDHSANNTEAKGYHGLWTVTQNIVMRFCVVPAKLFKQIDVAYGVVDFSNASYIWGDSNFEDIARYDVHMDAEDEHTQTAVKSKEYGESWINGSVGSMSVDRNKNLDFRLFVFKPMSGRQKTFPKLGFEYGVFGNIYFYSSNKYSDDEYGLVFSDDEDHSNANFICAYNRDLGQYKTRVSNVNLYDVIHQDRNTRFYMSKIKF